MKEEKIQVSINIKKSRYDMLKLWADDRDDSVANICRGWIYTGLADLQDSLARFNLQEQYEPEQYELDEQPEEPNEQPEPEPEPEPEQPD